MQQGTPMETIMDRIIRQNFGNIRDYYVNDRDLMEQVVGISAMIFHRCLPCPEPGGCYATTITTPDPPSRARPWALA
jgi:hypothetical protein